MTMTPAQPAEPVRLPDADPSPTESALATIWRRLLMVPTVERDDDFFALGGDSFRATQLANQVTGVFGVRADATLAFDRPVLTGQAAWIDAAARTSDGAHSTTTAHVEDQPATVPLSTQQREFLDWMYATEPARDPGAICTAIRIREPFDAQLLHRCLDLLTERHQPLRTVAEPQVAGRGVTLSTAEHLPPTVEVVTADGDTTEQRLAAATELARAERNRVGDLVRDPLVRALVIRIDHDDAVLVLSVHHFVFDGWSLGVLLRELGLLYSALRAGSAPPLRPLAMDYAGYCAFTAAQWDLNREHWKRVLHEAPRALTPFPGRRTGNRFSRRRHPFVIDGPLAARLRAAAQHHGGTPFMAVAACWSLALSQWSGATDIVLMSPVPGRIAPEHDALIGCLVQSLLIRVDISGAPDFGTMLGRVRASALDAANHQLHAYHETAPLVPYPARIHYESWGGAPLFPGLRSAAFPVPREQEDLDWPTPGGEDDLSTPELIVEERPDGSMHAAVVYNHHTFTAQTATDLAAAFHDQLAAATGTPGAPQ
ncbi:condensation domain-containing protein [Micromonospora coxensis]|uniref:condensation domain-containing protein n=1 Tax=Micromonospora coxensis TaxID=356852 RepID=UPI003424C6CB